MPDPLAPVVDSVFHGLFSSIDPLGMVLRTLMALLSDSLAQLITGMYASLFATTTVDFSTEAVGSIWRITTGLSAALATMLLVAAAFRGMLAQSSRYVTQALPGVVVALLGPQAAALLLPIMSAALTDLSETIVHTATPDLAESMRLLAGVGTNPIYEGLGLLAPLIASILLFGLGTVFFVLLFCMAGAVVLFVLSPFAFAGLVMGPTRAWFTRWATAMFAVLFAKVPIAILLALAVSLFADSRYAGTTQSFVNAAAGLILGIGAVLSPLLGYGLFSFMGTVATRPPTMPGSPGRAVGQAYYGTQMSKAGIDSARTAVGRLRTPAGPATSSDPSTSAGPGRTSGLAGIPREPAAASRATGRAAGSRQGASTVNAARSGTAATPGNGPSVAAKAPRGATTATSGGSATTATAAAAGAPTAGVGAAVVLGASAATKQATDTARKTANATTTTAGSLANADGLGANEFPSGRSPVGRGGAFGSADDHRIDRSERSDRGNRGGGPR